MTAYNLEIKNLNKFYGKIHALKNFNFKAKKGEIIALLGPNGAGKSTLMNMISGFLAPSDGEIFVLGQNIRDDLIFAKANIGFLPEGAPMYPDMTVEAFLRYMAEFCNAHKGKVDEVIEIANLEAVKNQKIETLSKGYARRVGFAQSILANPPVLLLDEPTDGLDPNQKEHIRKLIKEIGKNKTILISTHLLEEAESVCNRIIIMSKGEIKADGTLKEILKETGKKNIKNAFLQLTTSQD